jgi:small-conductance mechanosensitive channel
MKFRKLLSALLVLAFMVAGAGLVSAEENPVTPVKAGQEDPAKGELRAKLEILKKEREVLKAQKAQMESIRGQLRAARDQVRAALEKAREAGDRQTIEKAKIGLLEAREYIQAAHGITEQNRVLWAELKAAREAKDIDRAISIVRQLIANRRAKIELLEKGLRTIERVIAELNR